MDDFDLTQPMSLCFEEEEEDDDHVVETTEVTILKIPLQNDIPKELEFSLHNGMNRIGRSESCEVCIKNKVLSKEHAVIEVGGDCFLIYDLNSSNKTWKGKKPLKPNVKYKLEPRDEITFGHIKAQFLVKEEGNEAGDSGSETGSESMLLLNEEYCAFSVSTPIKNTEANEVGTNIVENASTSKATFPQKPSTAEEEKTESLKEAAVDLENAATEQFDGIDFCDSDAETDCEDHSEEKTITKEKETSHSEIVTGPQREEGTLNLTSNVTGSIKILNCDGESSIGSKNLADQAQAAEKIIDAQVSDNSFSKHQKLLRCHSLNVSSEELPPTQVNLNSLALESVANKEENIQHGKKILGSLDSLPETQPNTSIFYEDFEVPESPRHETDDDLPPTQCVSSHVKNNMDDDLPPTQCVSSHVKHNIDDNLPPTQCASSHVKNNIGNINSSVLKDRIVVLELPEKSESKDDLPPTQVNLALQFSEEQNFLQRDDSQSSYDNNTSSPKPSTSSGINCSRSVIPQCRDIHKKLVGSGGKGFEETSSVAGKSGRTLLSCINISVEEGSPSGGSSILCPSTQRRSDGCDYKIKNTDIHCSPTLPRVSGGNVSDSVAETPPHLLKESIMAGDFSSTVTSLSALSEVSPIALQNSASTSNSTSKTSGDHCTPDTHGKLQPKASTPDSARAGELNYSGNYSPKVYKTKLNDMDKSTQGILHVEQNDREVVSSNMPKSLSKKSKHPQNHIDKVIPESKARLDPASGNRLDNEDDIGSGKRQSRTNRKGKATRKTDNGNASITKNTGPKKLSPESNASLKTKQSTTGEPDNLNNVPQNRRSKRGIDASAKCAVSDISKEPHFESNDNNESEQQNPTAKPHTEKSDLEDSSVCLTNANDFKSSSSKRLARKKKPENDQSIQPLSSKRSKRQKCVPSEESNENGDICGGDITSDVTKEISEMDSKNDCATTPPRKSMRRKQLHFEQDSNISDTNRETDFSVFRKNEAREIEKESLVDTRQSKRRKVNPVKDVCENDSLVQVQSNKYNELSLNETEISISNSGEHSNIVAQEGRSDANKIQKSEGNCHGPAVQQKAKGKTDKNEMQHDSDDKTMKNNEKLVRTEERPLRGKRNRLQRKSPQLRQSRRRETQDTTSTDKPLSLDTSSKIENEDGMLNKLSSDKRQASRSKQSHKEEVMHHSNTNTEDASLLSMESSSRSLKLQLSASETSTDENLEVSEKCQISVFDSVVSLIKLDTQNLGLNKFKNSESRAPRKSKISKVEEDASKKEDSSDVSVQGVRKGRQSRTKFNLKEKDNVPEEEDTSDISVQGVKKGRLSRTKFSLKEKEEDVSRKEDNNDVSVQGVKRGRQSRAKFNLKEDEDIVSEKEDNCDISVQGVKKGRRSRAKFNLKEKEEDACKKEGNSDVPVQEARKGRQSRTKFNLKEKEDNVSGEGDNSDISVQGVKKGRQSRAKFNLKEKEDVSEKEDNSDVSVRGVKRARQLRTKFNLKEEGDVPEKEDNNDVSVQGVKRGRQSRAKFNLKEEEDNVSEKEDNNDVSVQGVKKGRQSRTKLNLKEKLEDVSKKEENGDVSFQEAKKGRRSCSKFNLKNKEEDVSKEEDNNDFPVQEAKKGRSKFNTKDNLSSSPSVKNKKHSQCLNSSSLSDSICENDVTPSKNKKAKTTQNATFTSPSSRSQQYPKPKVMFTMVEDEEPQKVVVNLGGRVVEDVNMCTHLVADKLRRTVKALCCIGKGIPLVNIKWIQECKKAESFVDHMPYLIKDKAAEKQYQFELQKTLQKAAEKPLLSSWSIYVTPKVVPSPEQMKDIIQCAGGKYLPKMPNRLSEKTVVVTCVADLNLCSHAIKCGIPVVGSEFILTGLFQYKIDTKLYSLSKK